MKRKRMLIVFSTWLTKKNSNSNSNYDMPTYLVLSLEILSEHFAMARAEFADFLRHSGQGFLVLEQS
jgi:hypothetical protein